MSKHLNGSILKKNLRDLIITLIRFGNKKGKDSDGFIFSCNTLDGKNSIFNQLINFLNEVGFDKKLNLVTEDLIAAFIQTKLEMGNSNDTIMEYISRISATFKALNILNYTLCVNEQSFENIRDEFRDAGHKSKPINRAFEDSKFIVKKLYEKRLESGILGEIQDICGYRIHEAYQVNAESIEIINNKAYIKDGYIQGKGGYPLLKKQIPMDLAKIIITYFKLYQFFMISQETYNRDIKYVSNIKYSSHSFRYNYAQNLYDELISTGYTKLEAELYVSNQMGHHRAKITRHYLAK